VAFDDCLLGDVLRNHRLAQALRRDEDEVAALGEQVQLERRLDGRPVDASGPGPVEVGSRNMSYPLRYRGSGSGRRNGNMPTPGTKEHVLRREMNQGQCRSMARFHTTAASVVHHRRIEVVAQGATAASSVTASSFRLEHRQPRLSVEVGNDGAGIEPTVVLGIGWEQPVKEKVEAVLPDSDLKLG
jgi:hypothetical protein